MSAAYCTTCDAVFPDGAPEGSICINEGRRISVYVFPNGVTHNLMKVRQRKQKIAVAAKAGEQQK
jgi:hypothetical protein